MKILSSTQYVDLKIQKEPWYQLSVINQWDWIRKPICYDYAGNTLIAYCLFLCTPISENHYKTELIKELTNEMKEILVNDGYSLNT